MVRSCVGPHGGRSCREYREREEVIIHFAFRGRDANLWWAYVAEVRRDFDPEAVCLSDNAIARSIVARIMKKFR